MTTYFYASVRLNMPVFTTPEGDLMAMENAPAMVPVYPDPADCTHETTMCNECAEMWRADWELLSITLITDDGPVLFTPDELAGWLDSVHDEDEEDENG